jgi:hypothetical protein
VEKKGKWGYTVRNTKKARPIYLPARLYVKEEEILIFITRGGNLSSDISHTHIY